MTLSPVTVHANSRLLMTADGAPFFWLGDTAWELFHRLTRDEARSYFDIRARQGFTVIQAVALAEFDGLGVPNMDGHLPLIDKDPDKPNDAYFVFVDECISMAAERGLFVALLPTWGDKVAAGLWAGQNAVFNVDNARRYGRWIGQRYANRTNVIWMIGGDRPAVYDKDGVTMDDRPIWRAMAEGIRESNPDRLMTYHHSGGQSSGRTLHDEAWLDMNSMQSGHGGGHDVPVWDWITEDLARTPAKPTLDSEPNYEDHPVNPWPTWSVEKGYFRDWDVRKQLFRGVFAGACGVTYGHHSIWQFLSPRTERVNHPECYWTEAMLRPGAEQAHVLRELMLSRPYFDRVPDQGLLVNPPTDRHAYVTATRDSAGSYALVYVPNAAQSVTVNLSALRGAKARAAWFDPRTGDTQTIGDVDTRQPLTFVTPTRGPDWVLTFDAK
jgi:Protein of unknown function (DUF4038)/Putative collagen-binding domain of a collagenase